MNIDEIHDYLVQNSDTKYRDFQKKLIFTKSEVLGVKMNVLKELAKRLANQDIILPYGKYLEYDFLNGLMISYKKCDLEEKLYNLMQYSLTIDNWGTCDTVACSTKFKDKELDIVFNYIKGILNLDSNYSKRFGVIFLMKYFIDYDQEIIFDLLKDLPYGDYYLDMGVAWYYSVLLAKNYDLGLKYVLKFKDISTFVYKKSIQKAIESFRVSEEHKEELKKLRK